MKGTEKKHFLSVLVVLKFSLMKDRPQQSCFAHNSSCD